MFKTTDLVLVPFAGMYASREAQGTAGALKGGSAADCDDRPRARDSSGPLA